MCANAARADRRSAGRDVGTKQVISNHVVVRSLSPSNNMALIKPMALIESMRKKVCMHSDVYFRTNKQTGKTFTGKLCYPSNQEPSAAQRESTLCESRRRSTSDFGRSDRESETESGVQIPNQDRFALRLCDA